MAADDTLFSNFNLSKKIRFDFVLGALRVKRLCCQDNKQELAKVISACENGVTIMEVNQVHQVTLIYMYIKS